VSMGPESEHWLRMLELSFGRARLFLYPDTLCD